MVSIKFTTVQLLYSICTTYSKNRPYQSKLQHQMHNLCPKMSQFHLKSRCEVRFLSHSSPQWFLKGKRGFLVPQDESSCPGLLFKLHSALSTGLGRSGVSWTHLSCPCWPSSPWVTPALGFCPLPFEALNTFGGDTPRPWGDPARSDPHRLPCPQSYFQPLSLSWPIRNERIHEG